MEGDVRLVCHEDTPEHLLDKLTAHELDVVLADSPIGPSHSSRAYNHLLGECRVAIFGSEALARAARRRFPQSLAEMPFLLPTQGTALRRSLDSWLDEHGIVPKVVGEFQDSALVVAFGELGAGLFAAPESILGDALRARGLRKVGTIDSLRERYYAISIERRLKHPALVAIAGAARRELFAAGPARTEGRTKGPRSTR
jgi:LysR family transcriptional activator of nhaA